MSTNYREISTKLIRWYKQNHRDLPWRKTKDPYYIWLSEIILQQTRVDQGLPYYLRFTERFKNVYELAAATQDQVLRLWQGLGYYSRARNLHECAGTITREMGGQFPRSYKELLKLKGIGPYTAAAIASISFGERVPVIDGNVFRVISRVFGIYLNIADNKSRKKFFELSKKLIPAKDPDLYNQAVMEFGSLRCTPQKPICQGCPLASMCYALEHSAQEDLPVKSKRIKLRIRNFNYLVFTCKDFILLQKRQHRDIWQGLYDFFMIEEKYFSPEEEILSEIGQELGDFTLIAISAVYKHILTHQRINARFFRIELNDRKFANDLSNKHGLRLLQLNELDKVPKPRLIDTFLADEKIYLNS